MTITRRHLLGTGAMATLAAALSLASGAGPAFAEGRKDVVIGMSSDTQTLLPNTVVDSITWAYLHGTLYEPLIARDAAGAYIPALAVEWSNPSETVWEFRLREGVTFQSGAKLTAEAVKYSIAYIQNPDNKSGFIGRISLVSSVEAVDELTVRITTSKPFAELLDNLVYVMIMEPGFIEAKGVEAAASQPNGTGPYVLDSWERGQQLRLVARDGYWGTAPEITTVTFRAIPEVSSRLSAFLAGEIDIFNNLGVDSIPHVQNTAGAKVVQAETARYMYLMLNNFYEGPLKDVRVRQAISHAVNRQEIIQGVLNGLGTELTGLLAPAMGVYAETAAYEHSTDKALALLKEAGVEPSSLKLKLETPNGRYPQDVYVAQAIAAQLARIGITVEVITREWGDFLKTVQGKQAGDMFLMGWGPNYEPQSLVVGLFSKDAPYSGHYSEEVEAAIQTAITAFSPDDRKAAYKVLQEQFQASAASVPLWVQSDVYAVTEKLTFTPRLDQNVLPQELSWAN